MKYLADTVLTFSTTNVNGQFIMKGRIISCNKNDECGNITYVVSWDEVARLYTYKEEELEYLCDHGVITTEDPQYFKGELFNI